MSAAEDPQRRQDLAPLRASAWPLIRGVWLAAGLLVLGCVAPPIAEAQEWYELYASGEQALRNGQLQRAADLLQRAVQKRPQPGVAIPTYGTNFEPRYFPYLRLAEAYLRAEAFDEALKALGTSARYGVEPAPDRAALEARAKAGADARRPPPVPAAAPAPPSIAGPPAEPPPSTLVTPAPAADPAGPPPGVASAPALPSSGTGLVAAPVVPLTGAAGVSPSLPTASVTRGEPVRRGPLTLEITSAPPGAQVFVDDAPVGRTDPETGRLRLTTLRPGRHRVRLSSEAHDDLVREIDLADESLAFHGALSLRQDPSAVPAPDQTPAESPALLPRRLVIGLGLGLVTALGLVVWLRSFSTRTRMPDRGSTPPSVLGAADEGTDETLPVQFGDYRLLRRIGKGGMASVYEAERRGERFALKRPLAGFLDDARFLERFLREADLGRTLHHPNVVRIVDRGQVGSTPYFAMELVDGETLRARLDREGRLDPTLAASVTAQVAEALDYAHHKSVVHRDLKPSNIMVERSGTVKVMDYGIARSQRLEGVTITGSFLGTPHYAAPEAVEGRTEPRSDVYSLGVVFFEMLTGSLPFGGANVLEVLHHHAVTPPPLPSSLNYALPTELDRIVLRLLGKDPSSRPTAEELLNELSDYLRRARETV